MKAQQSGDNRDHGRCGLVGGVVANVCTGDEMAFPVKLEIGKCQRFFFFVAAVLAGCCTIELC